jgi:4'-phosphopantetheinyl transferase
MPNPTEWFAAPKILTLTPGDLHVWRAWCEGDADLLEHCLTTLSADEVERADRFRIETACRDFIVTRAILRELLGRYLNLRRDEITLRYGLQGKPAITGKGEKSTIRFNVSHSHGLALLTFAYQGEVGVDVEWVKPEYPGKEIAERFFSAQEVAELSKLPPSLSREGFFKCWTRKEAYVKARGGGLQIPLRSFSVCVQDNEQQQLTDEEGKPWSVYPFAPDTEFQGAVAAAGSGWRIRHWNWRWNSRWEGERK